jgi:hypothetical protein
MSGVIYSGSAWPWIASLACTVQDNELDRPKLVGKDSAGDAPKGTKLGRQKRSACPSGRMKTGRRRRKVDAQCTKQHLFRKLQLYIIGGGRIGNCDTEDPDVDRVVLPFLNGNTSAYYPLG